METMLPKNKVVIGFSGGMDSTTLLGYLLEQGFSVTCVSFDYGSKHSEYELQATKNVIEHYTNLEKPVTHLTVDIKSAFQLFKSNLLLTGGEIPEGHYMDETMKQTVVPGRNLILISIMAGLAESIDAMAVAVGIHAGDHHIYPDCRPEFYSAANKTVLLSSDGTVKLLAPFLHLTKADILNIGYALSSVVPYDLTRTCYKNQEDSCGVCGSCVERLEAFAQIGKTDPVKYQK